jgi:hypothetical protein
LASFVFCWQPGLPEKCEEAVVTDSARENLSSGEESASNGGLHGLACPNCGGMVPIPEGVNLVECPYCELRSIVRGERGIQRYQVPLRVTENQAVKEYERFLRSNMAMARNLNRRAELVEQFLAYVPFWTVWAKVVGWVFGEEKKRSNNRTYYVDREMRTTRQMLWNQPACDVGEFGVYRVPIVPDRLQPFDYDALHAAGLVFEPLGSEVEAALDADKDFTDQVGKTGKLDRISQVFVRQLRKQMGLVYYPLWIMRYSFRGRVFQVVIDGVEGEVRYGKAPGNTLYRAAALVIGSAVGAFLMIDVSAMLLRLLFQFDTDDMEFLFVLVAAAVGGGFLLIREGYRRFRYGEHYEYSEEPVEESNGFLKNIEEFL